MEVACFLIFYAEQQQLMKSKEQMFTISDADAEHTLWLLGNMGMKNRWQGY